jgi:histidinol-phosphate aminotransferase
LSNETRTYYNAPVRRIWRPVLDQIAPYDAGPPLPAAAGERDPEAVVRLSANENPLGPSPAVVEAIRREAGRVHLYPDGGCTALRQALGRRLGVAPEQIVVGNGADELLALVGWAALGPGDEVVVPQPSFEPYTTVAHLMGARVEASPLAGYETDLEDMRRRVSPRTKLVILCSPHNPTGTIVRRRPLTAFLDALAADPPLVLLDEAYRDFCDDPEYPDGVALLDRYPRLIVLRTFSKIAGLAGLRVGYAIARAETIAALNRVRAPYNVNRLGQVAALAALEDTEHWRRTRELVIAQRAFLTRALAARGLAPPPSQANFLLVPVPGAAAARARLAAAGLLVRDGAALGFPEHLRISIGTREVNERLLAHL